MGEEKNRVQNGTPNGDMPPQEDSSKMPLTGGAAGEGKVEVKNAVADNGEAKVDIPEEDEELQFKGLTKEELMKYSQEPFWVRLRIALMIFFWLGWLVMLVLAIFIIIRAPQCEPAPSLLWVQESPILQVEPTGVNTEEVTSLMASLGLTSFYIPSLISKTDYYIMNPDHVAEHVRAMLEGMAGSSYQSVTDFVPSPVHKNHPWVLNSNYSDIVSPSDLNLNYESPLLETELQKVFGFWKSEYSVTGFLVSDEELTSHPEMHNLTEALNGDLQGQGIAVGERIVNMDDVISDLNNPGSFKQFVMDHYEDWAYYQYNPVSEAHRTASPEQMPPVTLCLMLLPGTPLMKLGSGNLTSFEASMGEVVREGAELRTKDAVKFGETQFANTTDNIVAYTRSMKGTPGYAVVVNLDGSEGVVDFSDLKYVPEMGTPVYHLSHTLDNTKVNLNEITIGPHEGRVLQFVATY